MDYVVLQFCIASSFVCKTPLGRLGDNRISLITEMSVVCIFFNLRLKCQKIGVKQHVLVYFNEFFNNENVWLQSAYPGF